jgi:DNA-binding CsgD family transcriptional regulator/predicted negative regulator of RcsB-dependent stress response
MTVERSRGVPDVVAPASRSNDPADLALRAPRPTDAEDVARFARTLSAVNALVDAGRAREAERLARMTLAGPCPSPAWAGRLGVALSELLLRDGRAAEALAEADAVLARPLVPDDLGDAAVAARLRALIVLEDTAGIQGAAEAILAGEERPGEGAPVARASLALAWVAWDEGRVAGALGLLRAAAARDERSDVGRECRVYLRLTQTTMLIALGQFDGAEAVLRQAAEEIALVAAPSYGGVPALFRARLQLAAGRLDEACTSARAALVDNVDALFLPLTLATIARISLLRGDLHHAGVHLGLCDPSIPTTRLDRFARTRVAAELAWARQGPTAARRILAEVYPALPERPAVLLEEPDAAAWLTRLALATGDRDQAEAVVACAEKLVTSSPGFAGVRALAAHARGLLDGDPVLLEQAEVDYPHPAAAASAAEDAGVVRTRRCDNAAAREALGRALAGYVRVGAAADADRVRARLRTLGDRPGHWTGAAEPRSGWASLTNAEVRVARIVAEGATNTQVANRLALSRHTVDFHLRHVFRKLGVRSRVELTRIAVREDADEAARP